MNPASWEQAKEIITDALKRTPSEREQFVRDRCTDPKIASEIITLLKAYRDGGDFLDDPASLANAEEEDDLEPGTRVGPYIIIDAIGRGGMGVVFLGTDPRLRRKVALKCVVRSLAGSGERRLRILHEARAAARVTHPNVATIHDVVEHENRAFIVMEYVEGENLAARLKRERLPIDRVIAIGRQLASALAAAHSKGVVHRDLKPSNVHIMMDGTVKVLDFGIANAPRMSTTFASWLSTARHGAPPPVAGAQAGTPPYMSPEQLLGRAVDERSDIYSLGVVLFEMAIGRRPFRETDAADLAVATAKGAPRADAVDARVPEALADVIERALAPNVEERFQSAVDVGAALDGLDTAIRRKPLFRRELIRRWAARVAVGALSVPVVFAILGLISTGIFNLTLGRRGFEAEPLSATLVWGARSVVGPFVLVVLLTAAVWMAALVFRLINTVPPVAGAMSRLARWPPYVSIRNLVLDPVRFAQTVSAGGAVAIIAICWRFRSVLEAFSDFADTMPASELAALADGQRQLSFRYYASLLIVVLGFCLVHILRLRARQPAVHGRSTLYSCMVVLAIAVVLNDAPYRLIHDATGERAVLNGMRCYVIGESAARVLLFCPELPAPRNRVVAQNDPALQRLGFRENIFAVAR